VVFGERPFNGAVNGWLVAPEPMDWPEVEVNVPSASRSKGVGQSEGAVSMPMRSQRKSYCGRCYTEPGQAKADVSLRQRPPKTRKSGVGTPSRTLPPR